MDQHADVILSNGAPTGFYGEGNDNSANGIGLMMQGAVWDYARLRLERPFYVDASRAMANRVVSTALLIAVTEKQAAAFDAAWAALALHPGSFNILGGNCSTHASATFISAGLLGTGIPGLDTPDHLYDQLATKLNASSLQSITGFLGFLPTAKNGYDMLVKPYVDSPAVNRPNPGSSYN